MPVRAELLAEQHRVVAARAVEHQHVGRVVIGDVVRRFVTEVSVDRVVTKAGSGPQRQQVDACSAVDRVAARLTFEDVIVGSTEDQIAATATEDLIAAAASTDRVVATERRRLRVVRVASRERIAVDVIAAAAADQHVLAEAAVQKVAVILAEKLFAVLRGRIARRRETKEFVATFTAVQPLADVPVVAEELVVTIVTKELVDGIVAVQHVVSRAATDHVLTTAAADIHVVAAAGIEIIRVIAAAELISSRSAEQHVVAGITGDRVIAVIDRAINRQAICDRRSHVDRRDITGWERRFARGVLRSGHEVAGPQRVVQDRAERNATEDHVVAAAARERIVAESPHYEVVAAAGIHRVVARTGIDLVIAVAGAQNLVATAGCDHVVAVSGGHAVRRVMNSLADCQ